MMVTRPSLPRPDRHLTTFGAMLRHDRLMESGLAPALQISAIEHPDLPLGWMRERMRQIAEHGHEARARIDEGAHILQRVESICRYLFEESNFAGNAADFGDPRNSCLNDVLDRKVGIPISLGMVLIAVGREAGVRIDGVGAPGHFLCSVTIEPGMRMFIDPFRGGEFIAHEAARDRVRGMIGDAPVEVCDHMLRPSTTRDILARMLHNMKNTYAERGNARRLIVTLDWLIQVHPANLPEIRNRGLVLLRMGQFSRAVQDIAFYIQSAPEAEDKDLVRSELERAMAMLARNN